MFKMTKVDVVPKKRAISKSNEIIELFETFVKSGNTAVLVESDKKYANKYGLSRVLQSAQKRYGYHSIDIVARNGDVYLVKKDL